MPSKKSTRVSKSVRAKSPLRVTANMAGKAVVAIAVCVMAGGIMVAARQSRPATLPSRDVPMEMSPMAAAPAKTVAASNRADNTPVSAAPSPSTAAAAVTLTGCLAREGDGFRLKDTSGTDAPKTRSWKSGFLKKGSATVDVVDAAHTLNLSSHVGRRVSVTGALDGREMTARALRRVAASCNAK
jgi:hypothetical protein